MIRIVLLLGLLVLSSLLLSVPVLAQAEICNQAPDSAFCQGQGEGSGTATDNRVIDLLNTVISALALLVGVIAVIAVIVGGFQFLTSGGDPNKVNKGRNTIIYAIVAIVVAVAARSIVLFVLERI